MVLPQCFVRTEPQRPSYGLDVAYSNSRPTAVHAVFVRLLFSTPFQLLLRYSRSSIRQPPRWPRTRAPPGTGNRTHAPASLARTVPLQPG